MPDGSKKTPKIPAEESGYFTNRQRVASRGSEAVGLNDAQRKEAEDSARENNVNIADKHYRYARRRPLLMLHVLNLVHKPDEDSVSKKLIDQVPAIGIAFPGGDFSTTVDYVVNRVWLNQMQQESFDNPDDEDDYDS